MRNIVRYLAALLMLMALAAAGLGIYIAASWYDQPTVLADLPEQARQRVQTLVSAVEEGDYATAEAQIFGCPSLGFAALEQDTMAALVWEAYQDSVTFEAKSGFYTTDSGLAVDYSITRLEIDKVLEGVAPRAQELMEQKVAKAEKVEEIYDSNHEYREELVQACVLTALDESLKEETSYIQTDFTIELICQDGTWWIQGNEGLISAISAGFAD